MTSCLSGAGGGGRTYGFDFDFVKSPLSSSSPISSPSSTISEISNNNSPRPTIISTKKPRTPRKRPNQTYNEAATLLSTAYPNLFKKPGKFTKSTTTTTTTETNFFSDESSELLLLPFRAYDTSSFLLQPIQHKPSFPTEPNRVFNLQEEPSREVMNSRELEGEDFDCESMLDEEMEEGIDSIMGSRVEDFNGACERAKPCFGFGGKLGFRAWERALRHVDDGNWWNFPAVDIIQISPGTKNSPVNASVPATEKKKMKKKKRGEKLNVKMRDSELVKGNSITKLNQGLMLKLNYDEVRNAWLERGSPFTDDCSGDPVCQGMTSLRRRRMEEREKLVCCSTKKSALHASSLRSSSGTRSGKSTKINGPE